MLKVLRQLENCEYGAGPQTPSAKVESAGIWHDHSGHRMVQTYTTLLERLLQERSSQNLVREETAPLAMLADHAAA